MNGSLNTSRFRNYTHQPCLYLAIVAALGICLGRYLSVEWYCWSLGSGVFLILSFFRTRLSTVFLYVSILSLAALYYQHQYLLPSNHIGFLNFQDQARITMVEGVVDSEIQIKPTMYGHKQVFELEISKIKSDSWRESTGRILINSFKDLPIHYKDHIRLSGVLRKPFRQKDSRFSYQEYLENHGLYFILTVAKNKPVEITVHERAFSWQAMCYQAKHKFKEILAQYLSPQETTIIQAMLLGDRSLLTKDIYSLFSKTGTSHILAISGMNMTIIGAIILFLLKLLRLPRLWQFVLTGIFLLFYAVLSGWSASVVRSVFMAIIVLSSFCLEQEGDTGNSLGLAAIVLFLFDPGNLFDIGFQLSFICVAMIIYLYPIIQRWIDRTVQHKILVWFIRALGVSFIAWLGTVCLIAYEFNMVSMISIVANILIVPLADVVVALSLGLVAAGFLSSWLAFAVAGSLKFIFNLMLLLIAWFAQIPLGYFYINQIDLWIVSLYYGILVIVILSMKRSSCKHKKNIPSI